MYPYPSRFRVFNHSAPGWVFLLYSFADKKNPVRAKNAHTGLGFYIKEAHDNWRKLKNPLPCYEVRGFVIKKKTLTYK